MDIWETGLEYIGEGTGELLPDDKWPWGIFLPDYDRCGFQK